MAPPGSNLPVYIKVLLLIVLLSSFGVTLWGLLRFALLQSREARDEIDDEDAESPCNLVHDSQDAIPSDLAGTVLVVLNDRALQDTKLALEAANDKIANFRTMIRFVQAQLAGPLSPLPAAYIGARPRSHGSIQDGLHVFWEAAVDLSAGGIAPFYNIDRPHRGAPFILSDLPNSKLVVCAGDDAVSIDLFGEEATKIPLFVTGVRLCYHTNDVEVYFELEVPWENHSILPLHGSFRLPHNHPVIGINSLQTLSNITGFSVQEVAANSVIPGAGLRPEERVYRLHHSMQVQLQERFVEECFHDGQFTMCIRTIELPVAAIKHKFHLL